MRRRTFPRWVLRPRLDPQLQNQHVRGKKGRIMNPLIQIKNTAPVLSRSKVLNVSFFVCLISLVALATASAQTPPQKRSRTEPLEKYDNPPAPPRKIETLPRMISRFGPFTSFQVNVDANGNNIVGDAANEPSIAVNPTDGSKMGIGWRQFDSVLSNFRQAMDTRPMAARCGRFPVSWKVMSSAATRCWTPMRQEIFSTLVCEKHFLTTC